jgi:hypothetical protein
MTAMHEKTPAKWTCFVCGRTDCDYVVAAVAGEPRMVCLTCLRDWWGDVSGDEPTSTEQLNETHER